MEPLVKTYLALIVALMALFGLMAASGVWLIFSSVEPSVTQARPSANIDAGVNEKGGRRIPAKPSGAQETPSSSIDVGVNQKGVKLKMTTAIPGLVVFVMGAAGLLLLALKVPVKRVDYTASAGRGVGGGGPVMTLSRFEGPTRVVSNQTERIPLLLWLLIRRQDRAERVES